MTFFIVKTHIYVYGIPNKQHRVQMSFRSPVHMHQKSISSKEPYYNSNVVWKLLKLLDLCHSYVKILTSLCQNSTETNIFLGLIYLGCKHSSCLRNKGNLSDFCCFCCQNSLLYKCNTIYCIHLNCMISPFHLS